MATHHESYPALTQKSLHSGCITSWVAGYVCEPYVNSLYGKFHHFGTASAHLAVVNIATYGSDNGTDVAQTVYDGDVAHIAGMPYLITTGKVSDVTLVPT